MEHRQVDYIIGEYTSTEARYDIPNGNIIGFAIETSGAWEPAAKRLVWSIAGAGGGPARRHCTTLSALRRGDLCRPPGCAL